jgi:hypothetical protein
VFANSFADGAGVFPHFTGTRPASERQAVMSDIFREVDEELRHDRMTALAKKYGGLAAGAALLIVVGTAGYVGWKHWQNKQRAAATAALENALTAAVAGGEDGVKALTALAGSASGDMGGLARLAAAAALTRDGKPAEAAQIYDALAADQKAPVWQRDLALLLSVGRQADTGDAAALSARLTPLLAPANPWRFQARELAGLLAARTGDRAKAQGYFQQLADDAQAPAGVRARAADLAAHYGRAG